MSTAEPKERGMLFCGEMVRKILTPPPHNKTQTRRIVKHPNGGILYDFEQATADPGGSIWGPGPYLEVPFTHPDDKPDGWPKVHDTRTRIFPDWLIGDHLWVRETWCTTRALDHLKPSLINPGAQIQYEADQCRPGFGMTDPGKTRVSIFMPRWASRITLEIESVRVERLHDITREDAIAEGVTVPEAVQFAADNAFGASEFDSIDWTYEQGYFDLWRDINGRESLDANPWVWVLSFKRVKPRPSHPATIRAGSRSAKRSHF